MEDIIDMQSTQARPRRLEARLLAYERRQINTDIHVEEITLEMTGSIEAISISVDSGFKQMGDIFVGVQQQLQIFDLHFEEVDERLDEFGVRLDKIEDRLDKVEIRLDRIESTMATKNDLAILRDQVVEAMDQMLAKWLSQGPSA